MRVLGIDPGTAVVGFGCIDLPEHAPGAADGPRIRNRVSRRFGLRSLAVVEAGVVRLGTGTPLARRLVVLADALDGLLARLHPDCVAVEEAFYGKSVQSALRIGEARGVVLLCAARADVEVAQYPPATVKRRVAGAGSASKPVLARMTGLTLGTSLADLPADATDALAVSLCHCLALGCSLTAESGESP